MKTKAEAYYEAIELGLEIRSDVPIDKVVKIYNGTGPEVFPDWARKVLDLIYKDLQPAVCGHDLDYYYGKGTRADFYAANERLERNGIICAKAKFGWWRLKRYILIRRAKLAAEACDMFGWSAYCDAIRQRKEAEELELEAKERNEK